MLRRFEIGCDNGERVRVAFALDCCDREAMSFLATTGGITGEDVRDLMVGQLLCRRRHPQLRPRHRARTEDDAYRKSEQRNG